MIVNVTDHALQPTDLSRENFEVTYRGHSLTPESVYYTEGPRRVMILVDVSGSMNDRGNFAKWKIARMAALDLVSTLPPGSKVGLITIATKNKTQFPLSKDRQIIADWLEREETRGLDLLGGKTALYDAIESALTQLQPHEPGDVIYVIGDGGENASNSRRSEVEEALRKSQVRLFTLILPPNVTNSATVEVAGGHQLASLSSSSGGFVETLGLPPGLRIVNERLKQEIRLHTVRLALQISAFYAI
ncbi:MAG: VWA domain-containing protein [Acidobacteriia bacterium]|nr:VWA domain-containing protein [Terriglobia bacterium]